MILTCSFPPVVEFYLRALCQVTLQLPLEQAEYSPAQEVWAWLGDFL